MTLNRTVYQNDTLPENNKNNVILIIVIQQSNIQLNNINQNIKEIDSQQNETLQNGTQAK
jgi:hypothetical protein